MNQAASTGGWPHVEQASPWRVAAHQGMRVIFFRARKAPASMR